MLAWEQANQELLWELSPSDIYDAIETHLTTLADNILNVEWEDFENVCYWIIELSEVYIKTIAEKFEFEKRLIVKELQKHGILSILTAPDKLTIDAVNKYLELKARRAI